MNSRRFAIFIIPAFISVIFSAPWSVVFANTSAWDKPFGGFYSHLENDENFPIGDLEIDNVINTMEEFLKQPFGPEEKFNLPDISVARQPVEKIISEEARAVISKNFARFSGIVKEHLIAMLVGLEVTVKKLDLNNRAQEKVVENENKTDIASVLSSISFSDFNWKIDFHLDEIRDGIAESVGRVSDVVYGQFADTTREISAFLFNAEKEVAMPILSEGVKVDKEKLIREEKPPVSEFEKKAEVVLKRFDKFVNNSFDNAQEMIGNTVDVAVETGNAVLGAPKQIAGILSSESIKPALSAHALEVPRGYEDGTFRQNLPLNFSDLEKIINTAEDYLSGALSI